MNTRGFVPLLALALLSGCGGSGSVAANGVAAESRPTSMQGPVPLQFEQGRDFSQEYDDFLVVVKQQHGDPRAIREAIGIEPTQHFNYTTVAGDEMFGAEYKLNGPNPGAPFFEAYAANYPGQSFYVFYQKSWFRWRAVDCGFHESNMFGGSSVAQK